MINELQTYQKQMRKQKGQQRNRKSQQRNRRHNEKPNVEFKTENTIIKKIQQMGSVAEWRGKREESVSLKTELQKLRNLNTEKK